jgi:tetratricopeptide (TPR) repeat protein
MSVSVSPTTRAWAVGHNVFHKFPISIIEGSLLLMEWMPGDKVGGKTVPMPHGVTATAWHPDGRHVAVGSFSGDLELRGDGGRTLLCSCPAHDGPVVHIAFTGDGQGLVSVGEKGDLKIRALRAGPPPSLPLIHAQPVSARLFDLGCPAGGKELVLVDESLRFTVLELPGDFWQRAALAEEPLPPSDERAEKAGDRLYGAIEGHTDAVLQKIGRWVNRDLLERAADDLERRGAAVAAVIAIAREAERADQLRQEGRAQEAIRLYLELNERIERLCQSNEPMSEADRTSLLHVQVRVTFFAGLEMMYEAGVDERMRSWQQIPEANEQLFRALELLQQSERIDRSLASGTEPDEDCWHTYIELGHLHHRLKNKEAAIECYTRSLQDDATAKQRASSFFGRAAVRFYSGDFADSVEDYLAAEAEGFHPPGVATYNAACAFALLGRAAEAVEMLRRAEARGYPSRAKAVVDEDFAGIQNAVPLIEFCGLDGRR